MSDKDIDWSKVIEACAHYVAVVKDPEAGPEHSAADKWMYCAFEEAMIAIYGPQIFEELERYNDDIETFIKREGL